MKPDEALRRVEEHWRTGGRLTFFLDYDGTLVPIAPTPGEALPDAPLIALLTDLVRQPTIRAMVLSGRPLRELEAFLPIPGLILAGLYGLEIRMDGETQVSGVASDGASPIGRVREAWTMLIGDKVGFLLEDKGDALALHARWAESALASSVLTSARIAAERMVDPNSFRFLDGDRYLEVAPRGADKGLAVDWLLDNYPVERELPVCFGDDNKDEAAFATVQHRGGLAIGVGRRYELRGVDARFASTAAVRDWLRKFAAGS